MPNVVVKVARRVGIAALFIVIAGLGILSGVLFKYAGDLPQVSAFDDYSPSTITRVYAASGQVIGEFATQRRIVVGYDDINPQLRQAIIATEDAEFDRHFGVNIWRIVVAAVTDMVERRRAQGASTLTQQLARNLKDQFGLTNEKSFERKIKEGFSPCRSRSATRRRKSSRSYCNQMGTRARRVRRRGGVASVFPEIEQTADAGRRGAHRRHLPDARAAESVRRPSGARPIVATSCCSGWRTSASRSRRRTQTPRKPGRS